MNQIAVITGTSTGLGASTAIKLASEGYRVYATMRDLSKSAALEEATKAAGTSIQIRQLDVSDAASIQACIDAIIATEGKIDIFINNAGAGFAKTTEHATAEEIEWVFDVNTLGVIRCVKAVLPHMRQARSGHIINLSSVGGLVGQPFNELYCAAKFALEGYTESLATYIPQAFNIKITLIEPGGISSAFFDSAVKNSGNLLEDRQDGYAQIMQRYIDKSKDRATNGAFQTPEDVANIIAQVIANPNPPLRIRTSPWAEKLCNLKTQADPTGTILRDEVHQNFLG